MRYVSSFSHTLFRNMYIVLCRLGVAVSYC